MTSRDAITRAELLRYGLAAGAAGLAGPASAQSGNVEAHAREAGFLKPFRELSLSAIEANQIEHLSAAQLQTISRAGLRLVYGDRAGCRVQDAFSGRWYWDCHRMGTTYNVGHRHPKVMEALRQGLEAIEIGNFMILSEYRALAAEKLVATTGGALPGVVFTVSASEANECAIKAARGFTNRTRIIAFEGAYHGDTIMALATGGDHHKRALYKLEDFEVDHIPFGDIEALEAALTENTAALIAEPLIAQLGFPAPPAGYWKQARRLCTDNGALIIFDEVQTGGGATGTFWGYEQFGMIPDILVSGKWPSGGFFPNSFALFRKDVHDWLTEGVFMPHPTTFGGSELGCLITSVVIDILSDPALLANVRKTSDYFRARFSDTPFKARGMGLCLALVDERRSNFENVRRLAGEGVISIPAFHDPQAVEFRPPLVVSMEEAAIVADAVEAAAA